jgi:hypothetical protein
VRKWIFSTLVLATCQCSPRPKWHSPSIHSSLDRDTRVSPHESPRRLERSPSVKYRDEWVMRDGVYQHVDREQWEEWYRSLVETDPMEEVNATPLEREQLLSVDSTLDQLIRTVETEEQLLALKLWREERIEETLGPERAAIWFQLEEERIAAKHRTLRIEKVE